MANPPEPSQGAPRPASSGELSRKPEAELFGGDKYSMKRLGEKRFGEIHAMYEQTFKKSLTVLTRPTDCTIIGNTTRGDMATDFTVEIDLGDGSKTERTLSVTDFDNMVWHFKSEVTEAEAAVYENCSNLVNRSHQLSKRDENLVGPEELSEVEKFLAEPLRDGLHYYNFGDRRVKDTLRQIQTTNSATTLTERQRSAFFAEGMLQGIAKTQGVLSEFIPVTRMVDNQLAQLESQILKQDRQSSLENEKAQSEGGDTDTTGITEALRDSDGPCLISEDEVHGKAEGTDRKMDNGGLQGSRSISSAESAKAKQEA